MTHGTPRQHGKHIIITGAGTGIGRAIALRLAREGASLSLLARTVERLNETAELAQHDGASAIECIGCDIRESADVTRAFESAVAAHGSIHSIVANAGIGGGNEPGAEDRFHDLVATNLTGTYHCLRATQQHLAEGPDPRHMVVVSSILARIGVAGYTGYCASKAALLGLVRSLAVELAGDNVLVNAVCPGWVDTKMARAGIQMMADGMGVSAEQAHAIAMQDVPIGRMGRPDEVAGLVAWMLSADAGVMTGQAIDQNGGAYML